MTETKLKVTVEPISGAFTVLGAEVGDREWIRTPGTKGSRERNVSPPVLARVGGTGVTGATYKVTMEYVGTRTKFETTRSLENGRDSIQVDCLPSEFKAREETQ